MELKKARKTDFKEIAEIYMQEFSREPYNEPWTSEKAIKKMEIFSNYCDIWKIIYQNKIIGFAVINPNQWCPGEIIFGEEMAIKKEFQGKGFGEKTLKKIFEIYKERGFKSYMGIINRNSKVSKLYEKLKGKQSKSNMLIERKLQ